MEFAMALDNTAAGKLMLERKVQAQIGRQLRGVYSDLLTCDLPERLGELLARLDAAKPGMRAS
jgi:Anti-sigma factor NepR